METAKINDLMLNLNKRITSLESITEGTKDEPNKTTQVVEPIKEIAVNLKGTKVIYGGIGENKEIKFKVDNDIDGFYQTVIMITDTLCDSAGETYLSVSDGYMLLGQVEALRTIANKFYTTVSQFADRIADMENEARDKLLKQYEDYLEANKQKFSDAEADVLTTMLFPEKNFFKINALMESKIKE